MKCVLALVFLAAFVAAAPEGTYTTKYDNIDLDEILHNDRLYNKYMECLMEDKNCTPDGKELKDAVPEALKTKCAKCTEKQKAGIEKVLKYVLEHKPEDFTKLESKYDKEGVYRKLWEGEAEKKGIKLPPKA